MRTASRRIVFAVCLAAGGLVPVAGAPVALAVTPCDAVDDAFTLLEDHTTIVVPVQNDGCNFFLTPLTQPGHGTIVDDPVQGGQAWDYTPAKDYNGADQNTYQGSVDGSVGGTATVVYTVTPVNDYPKAFGIEDSGLEDTSTVDANDSGASVGPANEAGQSLTISVVTADPSKFAIAPHAINVAHEAGSFWSWDLAWTPARDWCGSTAISVHYVDNGGTANGGGNHLIYNDDLTVTCVNDPPVAHNDQYGVRIGQTLSVASATGVLANDSDVDSALLSAAYSVLPTHGTLSLLSNGSFTYLPDAGFSGTDTFSYTASDGLVTRPATVTIRVDNTAPLLSGRTPSSGATSVARDVKPAATLNEPILVSSVTTSTLKLRDVAAGTYVAGTASVSGGRATFTPSTLLGAGRKYRLYATSGLKDLAGNAFAGTSWTFTVSSDATKPKVVTKKPASAATGISRTTNVYATFSESIRASTITPATVRLKDTVTGEILTAVVSYDSSLKRAKLDPSVTLRARRTYTVLLSSGIRDRAGNRLSTTSWSFKTGS